MLLEGVVFMVLFGALRRFKEVLLLRGKEIHSFSFYSHFGLLVSSFYFSGGILHSQKCIFYEKGKNLSSMTHKNYSKK
jgi:hypothetical protein